jgi:hypothetical protein
MILGPFLFNSWALLYALASTVVIVELVAAIRKPTKLRAGVAHPNSWKESV